MSSNNTLESNLPELVVFFYSSIAGHVDLPLLLVDHVIDAFLRMTLFVGHLWSDNQELLVLALTLLVLLQNDHLPVKENASKSGTITTSTTKLSTTFHVLLHTLSFILANRFQSSKISASLSSPPWWKCRILYWLSLLAITTCPFVQKGSE